MKQKCSSLIGMILLVSVLPACDLAKPMNKQPEPQNETPVTETAQKPEIKIAAENPKPAAIPKIKTSMPSMTATSPHVRQMPSRHRALPPRISQQKQLPPGWTPEQMAVAEQVKKELKDCKAKCLDKSELNDIRPICVGRNVVFSKNWLNFVGPNKPLSEKQFEQWRDRIDKVYESYEELTGGKPGHHDKIYIALEPEKDFEAKTHNGHAHRSTNLLCINYTASIFQRSINDIALYNSSDRTVMHEIAHLFENHTAWTVAPEGFVHLFVSYVMETNKELQYGGISNNIHLRRTAGNQHRLNHYQSSLRNLQAKKIDTYDEIFKMYLMGLVDKIGWDTYKQIFRSYHDKNFRLTEDIKGSREAPAREFLARIEHFSGNPDILKSLPDKGALLEKYIYYGPIPTKPKTAAIEK